MALWLKTAGVFTGAVVLMVVAAPLGCHYINDQMQLGVVPRDLHVHRILYEKTYVQGFGLPGDNDVGMYVFELPEQAARAIASGGPSYVEDLNAFPDKQPWYGSWEETPAIPQVWCCRDFTTAIVPPVAIRDFLDRSGHSVTPEEDRILSDIDRALTTPGNYYANGKGSSRLILAPAQRRAYYVYNG